MRYISPYQRTLFDRALIGKLQESSLIKPKVRRRLLKRAISENKFTRDTHYVTSGAGAFAKDYLAIERLINAHEPIRMPFQGFHKAFYDLFEYDKFLDSMSLVYTNSGGEVTLVGFIEEHRLYAVYIDTAWRILPMYDGPSRRLAETLRSLGTPIPARNPIKIGDFDWLEVTDLVKAIGYDATNALYTRTGAPVVKRKSVYEGASRGLPETLMKEMNPQLISRLIRETVPTDTLSTISQRSASYLTQAITHGFNLGIFVGEARETADMLIKLARGLVGVLRNIKRGNLIGALACVQDTYKRVKRRSPVGVSKKKRIINNTLKETSESYLWYIFGIQQFLSDIENSYLLLTEQLELDIPIVISEAKTFKLDKLYGQLAEELNITTEVELEGRFACEVHYQIDNRALFYLKALGVLDVLAVLWELVPLSFVSGWFMNVASFTKFASSELEWGVSQTLNFSSLKLDIKAKDRDTGEDVNSKLYLRTLHYNHDEWFSGSVCDPLDYYPADFKVFCNLSEGKVVTLGALASAILLPS